MATNGVLLRTKGRRRDLDAAEPAEALLLPILGEAVGAGGLAGGERSLFPTLQELGELPGQLGEHSITLRDS
jgi:hypothetical protein